MTTQTCRFKISSLGDLSPYKTQQLWMEYEKECAVNIPVGDLCAIARKLAQTVSISATSATRIQAASKCLILLGSIA